MAPKILVLLTDDMSAVLVRGQLGYLLSVGFSVSVGVHCSEGEQHRPFDEGVDVHHLDFVRHPSPRSDLRAFFQTIRLMRRIRPDVVHASTPKAGLIGMIAGKLCHVPIRVYQVRGLRYETEDGVRQRLYRLFERLCSRLATAMMFNSASVRRRAERDGVIGVGDGIILGSGNGVDTHRFTPATQDDRRRAREALGLSEDAFVIGFVGRLSKDKGIDDLVHAITIMNREETWLLLVGSYEVADAIDHKTSNVIATDDHIVHVPWTDNTKAIYTAIDVLAFPSYREGLPNVPLEAQACGVPIVGYAATGTIDAVVNGQTGILVPIGDRQALSSALDALLHDPELRKRLGTNARTHVVENFNPADVWKLIEATYRDALRNHASA